MTEQADAPSSDRCFMCGGKADDTMKTDVCLDCPKPGLTLPVCDACEERHQDSIYFHGWSE
jgi:hypothetical protein